MADLDPQDLESRIALLQGEPACYGYGLAYRQSGQIQKHKEYLSTTGRGGSYHTAYRSHYGYHPYHHRNSPSSPQTFKNKTLIINRSNPPTPESPRTSSITVSNQLATDRLTKPSDSGWIATTSQNAQIINTAAYNPAAARNQAFNPAAKLRQQAQVIRQQLSSSHVRDRVVVVDGVQYSVQAGGSKLVRVGAKENTLPTPKKVIISGIPFHRSKNGNLYRESIIRRNGYDGQVVSYQLRLSRNVSGTTAKSALCKRFANTGTTPQSFLTDNRCDNSLVRHKTGTLLTFGAGSCAYGPKCAFIHDPSKVAICREFLRSGSCSQGQHCDLSHDLTYERVPACVHFVRGGCTKENCPYPHVRINPAAPVCRAFTTLGYCSKGVDCKEKHVFECPDYAEGKCHNPKCRLPHVDRAGQLRQHNSTATESTIKHDKMTAKTSENLTALDSASDIDSEDEVMVDRVEPGFSQEHDFLSF